MAHSNQPRLIIKCLTFLLVAVRPSPFLAGMIVAGLGIAFALDAFWLEPSSIRITEYHISLKGTEGQKWKGLRIAVIADLHAGAPFIDDKKIKRVVAITNSARPDLTLLVGDYVVTGVLGEAHAN